MSDDMEEMRRQVEALTEQVKATPAEPVRKPRWTPWRASAARRVANKEFYQRQKAAAPTDTGSAVAWVLAVVVIGLLLWAVSSWWLDTMKPASEPVVGAGPSAVATTKPRPTLVPSTMVDGTAPQAVAENTVPAAEKKPLPAPLAAPADPSNAEAVMRSLAVAWLSRSGEGDSWAAAAAPWAADGMVDELRDAPMVLSALADTGDTAVQAVDLAPAVDAADAPTRVTRKAVVTVATTTGAPLVLQLGFTAYLDGSAWKVGIVEESSYTRATP